MKRTIKIKTFLFIFIAIALGIAFFTIFFDQTIIIREGTIYQGVVNKKIVALTFDDGPSPIIDCKVARKRLPMCYYIGIIKLG